MNPVALLWILISLPYPDAIWELRSGLREQHGVTNGDVQLLSRRHVERLIGRVVLLGLSFLIGLSSLRTPFRVPSTAFGWLILIGLFTLPLLVRIDGLRDVQLRLRLNDYYAQRAKTKEEN